MKQSSHASEGLAVRQSETVASSTDCVGEVDVLGFPSPLHVVVSGQRSRTHHPR